MKLAFGLLALLLFSIAIPTTSFAQSASNQAGDANIPPEQPSVGKQDALPTDGTYHGICWDGIGPTTACDFGFPIADPPWTMDCGAASCWFTVLDGLVPIDQFEVFDFGGSIGISSAPNPAGPGCGIDPAACLAEPSISRGIFCLGPGTHSITVNQILNPSSGTGWINAELHPVDDCGAVGGMFEGVNTTSLLVSGAQMNAAWMIPVIISAIGIAIVIARKF